MNDSAQNIATALPPILDFRALHCHFQIGRTLAYMLASAGEIESLTLGAPGKRGKRVFLTASVAEYLKRRAAETKPLNCGAKRKGEGPHAPFVKTGKTQRNTNSQDRH